MKAMKVKALLGFKTMPRLTALERTLLEEIAHYSWSGSRPLPVDALFENRPPEDKDSVGEALRNLWRFNLIRMGHHTLHWFGDRNLMQTPTPTLVCCITENGRYVRNLPGINHFLGKRDAEAFREAAEDYAIRVTPGKDKDAMRATLIRLGVYTKAGKLHPNYR